MRKTPPIKLMVHYPQTQQRSQEHSQRLPDPHPDAVDSHLYKPDSPPAALIVATTLWQTN